MPIIRSSASPCLTNPPPMEYQTCSSMRLFCRSKAWNRMPLDGRHAVPYIHHHIASVIEIDAMRAVEHQLAACLAFHTDIAHVIGIDGFRYVAFQARHRGAIGTVPKTGQGERTIQYRSHAADPVQYAVTFKGGSESTGRDHRSYGVRRAGPTPMVNISRMLNMYIALSFPRLRRHAA